MAKSYLNDTIRIRVLASGSSGNSILLSSGHSHLLVDAGLTCRELVRRFACVGVKPDEITAAIMTHEHQDHVRGVGVFSRQYNVPVYMNQATFEGVCASVGRMPSVQMFTTGETLGVGDLTVQTYPVPHDAAEPIGLTVENSSKRVGIVLDMGYPTKLVKQRLQDSDGLILEFNHDPDMLRRSARPWELKQRILGKSGHMSNEAALTFLCELLSDRLRTVVIAHISREANSREHVYSLVSNRLQEMGRGDVSVFLGSQDEVGSLIEV